MWTAVRFLWRATRKHRLSPWSSPYLCWRIETFSGMPADEVGFWRFVCFTWRERADLVRFLRWTGRMNGYRRHGLHPVQSSQAGPAEQ